MKVVSHRSVVRRSVFCLALCAVFFALCMSVQAQQPKKVPRIGYLGRSRSSADVEAFRQGLRDLGYIEGQTIIIEYSSTVT